MSGKNGFTRWARCGDDDGNIALTMLVLLVATSLIVTLTFSVLSGLRASRRSGDSANALQLADAGVNDAIKRVTEDTSTPNGGSLPTILGNLGSAGRYTVTAVKENPAIWHVTAIGTDPTGVRRKIKADAVAEALFSNAIFAQGNMVFKAGSAVDSFLNGLTADNACTLKGFIGSNTPNAVDLSITAKGNGNRNCTQGLPGSPPAGMAAYPYVYDGCVAYDDDNPPVADWKATGDSCGKTARHYPPFDPRQAVPDTTGLPLEPPLVCSGVQYLAPGVHFYTSVTLNDGCQLVDPAGPATQFSPVKIVTLGNITIGNGSNNFINKPSCPSDADQDTKNTDYYSSDASPLAYYCPGWAGKLQIYGIGGSASTINFANHVDFWGIVSGADYLITGSGSGSPHAVVFGALYGSSVSSGTQFTVHYDEALALLTTGRFAIENWREEPLP